MGHDSIYKAPDGFAKFNEKKLTDSEIAAIELRKMMARTDGKDKCTLCKAARLLEGKENSSGWDMWPFLLLIPLLSGGLANDAVESAMRTYIETVDKVKAEAGD